LRAGPVRTPLKADGWRWLRSRLDVGLFVDVDVTPSAQSMARCSLFSSIKIKPLIDGETNFSSSLAAIGSACG